LATLDNIHYSKEFVNTFSRFFSFFIIRKRTARRLRLFSAAAYAILDSEAGLYYLQSRYYDPEIGQFINADSQLNNTSVLGYNPFAYCENNPVNSVDSDGHKKEMVSS